MGSIGENFKSYLQDRNDLTEAEQDMLAANDFDRLSGRQRDTKSGVAVTKREIDNLERSIDRITSEDEVNERLTDIVNIRERGVDSFEQQARLDELENRLLRIENELERRR